jgi:hypothetical protein
VIVAKVVRLNHAEGSFGGGRWGGVVYVHVVGVENVRIELEGGI